MVDTIQHDYEYKANIPTVLVYNNNMVIVGGHECCIRRYPSIYCPPFNSLPYICKELGGESENEVGVRNRDWWSGFYQNQLLLLIMSFA